LLLLVVVVVVVVVFVVVVVLHQTKSNQIKLKEKQQKTLSILWCRLYLSMDGLNDSRVPPSE